MRKLRTAVCLSLLASLLLVPGAGSAQEVRNEIGLYTDLSTDPETASINIEPNVVFDVHMIVTNPFNEEFTPADCGPAIQRDINWINSFQFRILMPETGLFVVGTAPSAPVALVYQVQPNYQYVYAAPIPVPESRNVLLVTFSMMVTDADPKEIFLAPTEFALPILAIFDAEEWEIWEDSGCDDNPTQSVYPASGGYDRPVFGINTGVVATDNASWGDVKSLYR